MPHQLDIVCDTTSGAKGTASLGVFKLVFLYYNQSLYNITMYNKVLGGGTQPLSLQLRSAEAVVI